jgi:hypothetical protein
MGAPESSPVQQVCETNVRGNCRNRRSGPGRTGRVPGDLEEFQAEEEHHSGIIRGTELPVDGQAKDVAVEAAAAVRGAGGSRCSERPRHYSSITMSDAGGQRRTRAVPPICPPSRNLPRPSPALRRAWVCFPRPSSAKRAHPYQPSPGVLIASRVRSVWRQQWADGRVAGWSGNAGAAGTVTFTDVDFAVPKDNGRWAG